MSVYFFFFNDTATTEIYTLSLHDALPISTRTVARTACCRCVWHPRRSLSCCAATRPPAVRTAWRSISSSSVWKTARASPPGSPSSPTAGTCCYTASTKSGGRCWWKVKSRLSNAERVTDGRTSVPRSAFRGGVVKGYTIAVLPGDGIGPEVTAEAERVLRTAGERCGIRFTMSHWPVGAAAGAGSGEPPPGETRGAGG